MTASVAVLLGLGACGAETDEVHAPPLYSWGVQWTVETISPAAATIEVGDTIRLEALDAEGDAVPARWWSHSPSVAEVETGLVTGISPGDAVILAKAKGVPAAAAITVVPRTPRVAAVEVVPGEATVEVGASVQLAARALDAGGAEVAGATFTWTSGSPVVATVSGTGLVTAQGPGTAVVVAESDGVQGTSVVTVPAPPAVAVSLTPSSAEIAVGGTVRLTATVTGSTETAVTYESGAPAVATVDGSGLVTGLATGSATITARSVADPTKTATAAVTVAAVAVSVSPTSASLDVGETQRFTATVTGAVDGTVTWSSSDAAVAAVDATGLVTAKAAGTATIVARSAADPARTATASVTVQAPPPPPPPPSSSAGVWIGASELAALPTSGTAWNNVKSAADKDCGTPDLANQDQANNVCIMAKALVFARIGGSHYRDAVVSAIRSIVGSGTYDGRALSLGRELAAYVIAADLISLASYDAALDQAFRSKLAELLRTYTRDGPKSLVECHEIRPNNWGTHCGASRVAVAAYLGDTAELDRVARVFRGWLGDRSSYAGFKYDSNLTWHCDPAAPVGINPKGCTKDGYSIDGVLPDDQRRGGSFTWPPPKENYVWEALQGALAQAVILSRRGYDVWNWEDKALLRAFQWLHTQAAYPADGDDTWQPFLVNRYYGTSFPAPTPSQPGKNVGWTDWTHR